MMRVAHIRYMNWEFVVMIYNLKLKPKSTDRSYYKCIL